MWQWACKAGVVQWRTRTLPTLISTMESLSSESSTAMEVSFFFIFFLRTLADHCIVTKNRLQAFVYSILCIIFTGQEVALWVKENFKKELIKLQSFKSKCYKEALEECFLKMDVMMQNPAGQRRLSDL